MGLAIAWARKQVKLKNARDQVCFHFNCYALNRREDARFHYYYRICQNCKKRLRHDKKQVWVLFGERTQVIEGERLFWPNPDFSLIKYRTGLSGLVVNHQVDINSLERFLVYLQEYPEMTAQMQAQISSKAKLPAHLKNSLKTVFSGRFVII